MACELTRKRKLESYKSQVHITAKPTRKREEEKRARHGVYAERRAVVGYQNPRYY
jgi:hypothetical protein